MFFLKGRYDQVTRLKSLQVTTVCWRRLVRLRCRFTHSSLAASFTARTFHLISQPHRAVCCAPTASLFPGECLLLPRSRSIVLFFAAVPSFKKPSAERPQSAWGASLCTPTGTWTTPNTGHISASSGCYTKNTIDRKLKQQTFISRSSGGWKTQDQGASRFGVCGEHTAWVTDSGFLAVSLHGREKATELSGVSFIRVLIPSLSAPPYDLIISQSPYLLVPACWGLVFQKMNLRGAVTFSP